MWLMLSAGSSCCFGSNSGDARWLISFWLKWAIFNFLYVVTGYCCSMKDDSSAELDVFESEPFLIFSLPIFLIVVGLLTLFWKKRGYFTPCGYVWKQDEISRLCFGVLDEIFFNASGFFSKFVENIDCETFGVDAMKSDDLFRPRIVLSFSILASFLLHNLVIGLSVCVALSTKIYFLWIM